MKKSQILKFIGIILILSIIVGIMIHFNTLITALGLTSKESEVAEKARGLSSAITEVFVSSVVAFFTFMVNYYIIRPFDSSIQLNKKRIATAILFTLIAVTLLSDSFFAVKHLIENQPIFRKFNLIYSIRDLFTGIIVIAGMSFIKTIYDKQYVKIEIEMLKNEKLISQYESLKNQISPHFMFNSLTALRELIDENPSDAKLYISHLSHVLRYTLSSIESQSRPLYEELEVAESYFHLVKIRFGASLSVETSVDDRFKNYRLPPLAIQTLLENAIKHNEISKKNPFAIRIETGTGQSLIVTNVIRERATKEYSSGLGLSNLSKQYQYLAEKDISISIKNNEFRVELPLLNPNTNESPYS